MLTSMAAVMVASHATDQAHNNNNNIIMIIVMVASHATDQARLYSTRPGHAAVAAVGIKGVFLKDAPSFEELIVQLRWATANVQSAFLAVSDCQSRMWDLTSFPEWACLEKVGPNAYSPVGRGSLVQDAPPPHAPP